MRGCGNFSLVGVSGSECCVVGMRCKRWSCQYCGARKVRSTVARIRAGMRLGSCRFFTLTAPGDEDPEDSLAEFAARWKRFRMRLERRFGRIEYLGAQVLHGLQSACRLSSSPTSACLPTRYRLARRISSGRRAT